MALQSLFTSCKNLSSIIRGRVKRKNKPANVAEDIPFDESLECLSSTDPCSSDNLTTEQFQSSPSQSHADESGTLRSSSSVLSSNTRLVIRNFYRTLEHDRDSDRYEGDEDEDEELASDTTKLEDSYSPISQSYTSILLEKASGDSSSTLCCTDSCSSPKYVTDIGHDSERHASRGSADHITISEMPNSLDQCEDLCKNRTRQSYNDSSEVQTWPFPTVASSRQPSELTELSSPVLPVAKKSLKRVKSVIDLKKIRTIEDHDETSYSRKRKAGMIGLNHSEMKSRLKAISLFKKTSQPLLKLRSSLNSLNGTLPTSFFLPVADCGLYYDSNFIEVLDYDKKRVHEIQLSGQYDHKLQPAGSGRVDTCSVSSEPSTSASAYSSPTLKPPILKRVRFAEPIAFSEDDDEEEEERDEEKEEVQMPQITPRARLLPPSLSSFCQRKKEDWSNRIRNQYSYSARPATKYAQI